MKPIFVYNKWLPFGDFDAITILLWVFVKMRKTPTGGWYKQPISERLKRHETWHMWQQICLFVLGMLLAMVLLALNVFKWWVWLLPVLFPFVMYVACWVAEIILPPYDRAYKDICFESEAMYHEYDENPRFVPFSFFKFIPNKDWRELGKQRFDK